MIKTAFIEWQHLPQLAALQVTA